MKKFTALKINRMRCIFSSIICLLLFATIFLGVLFKIVSQPNEFVDTHGVTSFRMFTVLSNSVCALCALLAIPYTIEGYRSRNYHLPRWLVYTLYTGVTAVTITFIITVGLLAPVAGWKAMLFTGSNIFLHFLGPLLAILMFIFINCYHTISFKASFIAIAPVLVYAVIYLIMVFGLGKWDDYYRFGKFMPWPVTAVLILPLCFGIANLLRFLHNTVHKRQKKQLIEYYMNTEEFSYPTIEDSIIALAIDERKRDNGSDILIPRRIIKLMIKKYNSKKSIAELSALYLNYYLDETNK